ncbi:inositol-tetrakisphosphate 1-kinase 2 [Salvia miltiorrhiza]|uniref:inositol-tetrakisphosphate 1-kinase 2 n=1 Tax=Salvia miltiorrhiza TaxID=226208 RepID=UPI0025AD813D|nr:inositol-tetrakisphosphate 1-kinase 2 [Salvia miltiorrhiza]XP_057800681.1 inositol-tetrakisphosphate 1-kinase 2 [Salvia miltiorrhiza]XP_057800682.1 inositol-tetrakisphosphate 1-kinase 2 [Salvia miltiorrhiza]XP_057800683.1 inositol-tetrakisphosphate 1-kinase 2 [Salvia miltiorrhiza]XP_057800685.1 inositol-tetrakisphosphate 1-kinase 2 [Salvia miltiorrhiza]XP_057800686.1 inositol-tetrakisphosphate 1-kinase 2 [Salvia miltiorrhiza]XP_057800687.1 inositol-tetrakisphosphate 1-kinase 2 [Salvia milt
MSEDSTTRYRIGYALAPKKVQSFIQPSLLNLAKERGIDLFPVQITKPLIDQFPLNCIIHKLSDPEWRNQLEQLLVQKPNVVVIDRPEAIERLHNRVSMLQAVNQLEIASGFSVGVPKQVSVENPQSLIECVASSGLSFPVIAKPLVANGTAGSHQMSLVFNEEGLRGLKLSQPFVLQEFVNHGAVIFKVYVAGQHIQCVKRRSLPDISEEKLGVLENSVSFSQISNVTAQDQSGDGVEKLMEAAELPPSSFVTKVASQLRETLKLNLFNFDMIRDSSVGGRYLVIDINYFPGYAKMPCYETILTDFFLDIVQKKPNAVSEDC